VTAGRRETPGGVILEEERWHVSHMVSPAEVAGFLIFQPTRHVEHIADLTSEEAAEMGQMLSRVSRALMNVLSPRKVYVCSFGSVVKHVHFYLIPRMPGMSNAARLLDELQAGRWDCSDDEAADVAGRVRAELMHQSAS